jgi:transposase
MLNCSAATRVFVATAPVDLRASFNRLFALTQSVLKEDPLSGHWFVFTNQERNRVRNFQKLWMAGVEGILR